MNTILKTFQALLKNKKRFALMGFAVVVLVLLVSPELIHAQATAAPAAAGQSTGVDSADLLNKLNFNFNMLLRGLSSIFWPILLLIGSLLDNSLIFGGSMEERLLSAWVEIRNLVNIIFVLILVAIALYNVLGLGQDGGPLPLGYKAIMPKFLLALIVVNFSFTAVKVILDASNIVTGAVFALPEKTISDSSPAHRMEVDICGKRANQVPVYKKWCDDTGKFNAEAKSYFNRLDRNNISVVYAIRYGKANQLNFIRDGIKDIGQLGFNIIFNTVLFIVYTVGYLALFIVLATRLVVIWLALVMSPLYALSLVLPSLSELSGGAGDISKMFVKTVIAPIIIGLSLSVGYIMLDALSSDTVADPLLVSTNLTALDPNALPTDINTLQELLIAIGSVVIIWKGTFAGTSGTFAEGITNGIKGQVEGFGGFLAKLPLYAQWIPIGSVTGNAGDKGSLKDMQATIGGLINKHSGPGRNLLDIDLSPEDRAKLTGFMRDETGGLARAIHELPYAFKTRSGFMELIKYMKENSDKLGLGEAQKKEVETIESMGPEKGLTRLAEFIRSEADRNKNNSSNQFVRGFAAYGSASSLLAAMNQSAALTLPPGDRNAVFKDIANLTAQQVQWNNAHNRGQQYENFQSVLSQLDTNDVQHIADFSGGELKEKPAAAAANLTYGIGLGRDLKALIAKLREAQAKQANTADPDFIRAVTEAKRIVDSNSQLSSRDANKLLQEIITNAVGFSNTTALNQVKTTLGVGGAVQP